MKAGHIKAKSGSLPKQRTSCMLLAAYVPRKSGLLPTINPDADMKKSPIVLLALLTFAALAAPLVAQDSGNRQTGIYNQLKQEAELAMTFVFCEDAESSEPVVTVFDHRTSVLVGGIQFLRVIGAEGKKKKAKRLKDGTPCPSASTSKDYVFNLSAIKPHVAEDKEVWVVSLQLAGYGTTPVVAAVRQEMPYMVELLSFEGVYSVKEDSQETE
jgi:hypothetical protein